ncbi:MAG: NADH:ubiquinone oxidoreductase [Flavobacteria bacterium RIFCSPLOWO2_12_FULL_31_7]|nr:MAG: NADH:ubiquinone oxidoreductase [Flavobacteria bacterium RIFCSPLOWO2_12_FULL_31_7]
MIEQNLVYKAEAYKVIGLCMEVHSFLGKGHNEKVYGDALELELRANHIPYVREQKYTIEYKGVQLPSYYYSDFTVYDDIIVELKAIQTLSSSETKQVLNYLAASKCKLDLLINFGEDSLKYQRIIL